MTERSGPLLLVDGTEIGAADEIDLRAGTNVTLTGIVASAGLRQGRVTIDAAGAAGAPSDADYLVGTANATLTNEIVVGATPGGELGGTWAAPTVDATHSGSAHHTAFVQADHDALPNPHHAQAHSGSDHTDPAAATTVDIGDVAAAGTGTNPPAADDHVHGFPAPTAGYPVDVGASEADGTATTPARSDHAHAHGTITTGDLHSNYVQETLIDAAGDLLIGSAADTAARLARGTAGQVLESTSTTVAWRDLFLPVVFSKQGTLSVTTGALRWYNDTGRTLTISSTRASVGTAPTGASLIVDVNIAGTTIFTTQSNRPTIAISGFTDEGGVPDVTTIADGNYFTVDIDQVGSTVAGSDLTVAIWLTG